jgi:hypothetical protein
MTAVAQLHAAQRIAEADEAMLQGPSPVMALHAFLDAAAACMVAAERGDHDSADALYRQASEAAPAAFDVGSPESIALRLILRAVSSAAPVDSLVAWSLS